MKILRQLFSKNSAKYRVFIFFKKLIVNLRHYFINDAKKLYNFNRQFFHIIANRSAYEKNRKLMSVVSLGWLCMHIHPRLASIAFDRYKYIWALARAPDLHLNIHQLVTSSHNSTHKFHTFPTNFQQGHVTVLSPDSRRPKIGKTRPF